MGKVIKVDNLSKAYQLGDFGTGTISRDIERFFARIRGKEDPFLKIGETNDRTVKGERDVVWSLKDINFEIEQGDAVGIIGRNGAGKSTLLKILSRITAPTTGSFKVKGRIASLLEVGTGFHPELSGRENIYLNGTILGMRKAEIKQKFDEIVDFSGVERYIDTPVKRYSSGMYVRLAFAVAAHLESEILIVDEVLAVGDAEFQKKCLGKMGEVSKGKGKTILFVSHNMEAVKTLCKTGISLMNGVIRNEGRIDEVIDDYLNESAKKTLKINRRNNNGWFNDVRLFDENDMETTVFKTNTEPYLIVNYSVNNNFRNFNVGMTISDVFGTHIYSSADTDLNPELLLEKMKGDYSVKIPLPLYNLNSGSYNIKLLMGIINIELFDSVELSFSVDASNFLNTGLRPGLLISLKKWDLS
jgi:homopolymeric O-antigen transport system ATP-binding protein